MTEVVPLSAPVLGMMVDGGSFLLWVGGKVTVGVPPSALVLGMILAWGFIPPVEWWGGDGGRSSVSPCLGLGMLWLFLRDMIVGARGFFRHIRLPRAWHASCDTIVLCLMLDGGSFLLWGGGEVTVGVPPSALVLGLACCGCSPELRTRARN